MSKPTKGMLADALEELLATKPLSKITVSEIAETSSVSRMTFYYHFKDIYDLVKWSFTRSANEAFESKTDDPATNWCSGLTQLFRLLKNNESIVMNVYNSVGHGQLYSACADILEKYARSEFDAATKDLRISDADRTFVATFFTNAVVGICFEWVENGMHENEVADYVNRCSTALSNSVMQVLYAFESASGQ